MTVRQLIGDCREVLRTLPDESVHRYEAVRERKAQGGKGWPE